MTEIKVDPYKSIHVGSGMVSAACNMCGALIVDWPKDEDGEFTTWRPNQDRHLVWHKRIDPEWYASVT